MKKEKRKLNDSLKTLSRCMGFLKEYKHLIAGSYGAIFAINAINVAMPLLIRRIVDLGIRGGDLEIIIRGVVLLLIVALLRGLFTFLSGRWTEVASQHVAYDLRNRIHAKLQSLSFGYHDQAESGQLLTRSVSDVDRVRFLTGRAVLRLIEMFTLMLGVAVAMLFINYRLALASFVVLPGMLYAAFAFGMKVRPISRRVQQQEGELTGVLDQNLRGARIVRAFGMEESGIEAFEFDNTKLLGLQLLDAKLRAIFLPMLQFLTGAATVIVLLYGGKLVMEGNLTIGELVAFTTYLTMLMMPMRRFGWVGAAVAQAVASGERIFEILDASSEVEEAEDAVTMGDIEGSIRFEDVSFSYFGRTNVLEGINFTITPGETVALLGTTGSGKSSIINLIPRFYDVNQGVVYIDNYDVRSVTIDSLRKHIGIVLQDTTLFAASIRENIIFARPEATDEEMIDAARAAGAHDFIAGFSEGYDTKVGERGATLSGGQKQRVAIARALLMNPRVLILDDATSSVDTETESRIQAALDILMEGRTSVVIAQRLSTVRKADVILVLDGGNIAAMARKTEGESPHDILLRDNPIYSRIYEQQLQPAEEATVVQQGGALDGQEPLRSPDVGSGQGGGQRGGAKNQGGDPC